MVTTRKVFASVGLLAGTALGIAWTAPPSQCRPAGPFTARVLPFLDSLVTHSDSLHTALRQTLGLTQTTSNQVKLVTKAQTCTQAANAVDLLTNTPNSGRKVWVFQIGPAYAVTDSVADHQAEPGQLMSFFSSAFVYKSATMVSPARY